MLNNGNLSSRSKTRIPDQFMESELAKEKIYKFINNFMNMRRERQRMCGIERKINIGDTIT